MPKSNKRTSNTLAALGLVAALFIPAQSQAEEVLVVFPSIAAVTPVLETSASETMALVVDFAVVVQIDGDIGSIVLGNAEIADAMVADGRMIVLTGKSAGTTNMIVMDADNQLLAELTLQVSGRKPGTVTVRRALEMQSYGCSSGLCDGSSVDLAGATVETGLPPL